MPPDRARLAFAPAIPGPALGSAISYLRREGNGLLVLAGVVIAQAIFNWHFASQSYFVGDDVLLFEDAVAGPTAKFLFGFHGDHFSPGRQAIMFLLQRHASFNFELALGILVVAHSAGVVLLQRILRLLFGAKWWTLALAFAYGISIFIQPSLQWLSAGALILPSVAFSLASIHAYLCWWRTGRRVWLAWSVVSFTAGLLFYVKALLVPLYLIMLRLLDPADDLRTQARKVARQWRVWAVYAAPVIAIVALYLVDPSAGPATRPPLGTMLDFLATGWAVGFIPGLLGVRVPAGGDPAFNAVAIVLCQAALIAAIALSVSSRREAWRAWFVVGIGFVLSGLIVSTSSRLAVFGRELGYVIRYFTEPAYLGALVIPFAFASPRWARALAARMRGAPKLGVALGVSALAAYSGFAWASDAAFTRHWDGQDARAWTDNLHRDLRALRARHVDPVLIDAPVSPRFVRVIAPTNRVPRPNSLAAIIPLLHPGVRVDEVASHTYRVRNDGHLQRVAFEPATGIGPGRAPGNELRIHGGATQVPGNGFCVTSGDQGASAELLPQGPLYGRTWYLRTAYRTDTTGVPFLGVDRGIGYPPRDDLLLPPRPRGGESLTGLKSLPTGKPTFARIKVDLLPGHRVCFMRFEVGSFVPFGARRD